MLLIVRVGTTNRKLPSPGSDLTWKNLSDWMARNLTVVVL
jgi:hypothetical protein